MKGKHRHKCQICQRIIDDRIGIMHAKAEEYLINLIKKDHPEWNQGKKTCPECITYYRELVKKADI